jgi:hypothetical protein
VLITKSKVNRSTLEAWILLVMSERNAAGLSTEGNATSGGSFVHPSWGFGNSDLRITVRSSMWRGCQDRQQRVGPIRLRVC